MGVGIAEGVGFGSWGLELSRHRVWELGFGIAKGVGFGSWGLELSRRRVWELGCRIFGIVKA